MALPNIEKLTNEMAEKVKFKKMAWGKSISLDVEMDQIGIALFSANAIYVFWRNGGELAYTLLAGESHNLQVSVSADNNTITFSAETDFAMTMFYA